MNLIKRLRNLWKLSEIEPSIDRTWEFYSKNGQIKQGKPIIKMAQIITRRDPIKEVLKTE